VRRITVYVDNVKGFCFDFLGRGGAQNHFFGFLVFAERGITKLVFWFLLSGVSQNWFFGFC